MIDQPKIEIRWSVKPWEALSKADLYEILQLRIEVFVVEQDCPYQDADGKDHFCHHVLGYDHDNELVAYTRLVPKGISYDAYTSIGRVINKKKIRRQGVGIKLMHYSLDQINRLYPGEQIKISAQVYLLSFYKSLGFEAIGEEYLEDNIPHMAMVWNSDNPKA